MSPDAGTHAAVSTALKERAGALVMRHGRAIADNFACLGLETVAGARPGLKLDLFHFNLCLAVRLPAATRQSRMKTQVTRKCHMDVYVYDR